MRCHKFCQILFKFILNYNYEFYTNSFFFLIKFLFYEFHTNSYFYHNKLFEPTQGNVILKRMWILTFKHSNRDRWFRSDCRCSIRTSGIRTTGRWSCLPTVWIIIHRRTIRWLTLVSFIDWILNFENVLQKMLRILVLDEMRNFKKHYDLEVDQLVDDKLWMAALQAWNGPAGGW